MNVNLNNDSEDNVIPETGDKANRENTDAQTNLESATTHETENTSDIQENITSADSNICDSAQQMEKFDHAPRDQQDTGPESANTKSNETVTAPTNVKEGTTASESKVCESIAPQKTNRRDPKAQETFDHALRAFCPLVDPTHLLDLVPPGIGNLRLESAPLPAEETFTQLLSKLTDVEELDIDKNEMGPQAFRVLMLALSANTSIKTVVLSNNMTDTDTAESVGVMLMMNETLRTLDLSSNQLGKDYLSRCIGPAFKTNTSLTSLNISSCGATDLDVLVTGLQENTTLKSLDISHNQLSNSASFVASLSEILKNSSCAIRELNVRNCGIHGSDLKVLGEGIKDNTSLTTLSAGGNSVDNVSLFMNFLVACLHHIALENLNVNDTRIGDTATTNVDLPTIPDRMNSHMMKLNLANCSLTDDIMSSLANHLPGCLPHLSEFSLSGNADMTVATLQSVAKLTSQTEGSASALTSLHLDQLSLEDLPQQLLNNPTFPSLKGLSICKARIPTTSVGRLCDLVQCPDGLTELCLSGLKLSETGALAQLLQPATNMKLNSLSLAGCALKDDDLQPLTSALTAGWHVTSLTLANNRLTGSGVNPLLEAMVANDEPPIESVNLNSNQLSDECKDTVTSLVSRAKKLHTLSLNRNELGCETISSLLESLHLVERLKLLDLRNQASPVDEEDMEDLMKKLASQLGYTVHIDEYGAVEAKRSPLPTRQCDMTILLTGLGCDLGPVGRSLDSAVVKTDHRVKHPLPLSLQHALHLGAWMTSQDLTSQPELSESSWEAIIGIKKDPTIPSWLKVEKLRDCAVYISNLSSNVSASKLEGDLDAEADCNVREVCIMKDPIQRKPNGYAWVLMADKESVKRAMDFYYSGQALMFSQPYIISPVSLKIPDITADENAEHKVSEEMARREKERVTEAVEHQQLLETSFAASRARHEYAKAHPAYADGRIF